MSKQKKREDRKEVKNGPRMRTLFALPERPNTTPTRPPRAWGSVTAGTVVVVRPLNSKSKKEEHIAVHSSRATVAQSTTGAPCASAASRAAVSSAAAAAVGGGALTSACAAALI